MCWAMYLFTESEIQENKWDKDYPRLFIENIKNQKEINNNFNILKWNENNKKIYYIGSSQGCGCGWKSPEYDYINLNDRTETKELENRITDRKDLYKLLKSSNLTDSYIVICWEGEEGEEITNSEKLNIENISNVNYNFIELTKYILE